MATKVAFDRTTTCEEVVAAFEDVAKTKNFLITGISPNGLGEAMAYALAERSAGHLILTARAPEKATAVVDGIKRKYPLTRVTFEILQMDISSIQSVRQAVVELSTETERGKIDIVINNAGVMAVPERTTSVDDQEIHFATNFLGHWLLFNLLRKHNLLASSGVRIVNVTSGGYMVCPIRFSDISWTKAYQELPKSERPNWGLAEQLGIGSLVCGNDTGTYDPMLAYLHSNTATMLCSVALSKQSGTVAISAAPGVVVTELQRHVGGFRNSLATYKSPTEGASSFLVAALDPSLNDHGGAYIDDCQIKDIAEGYVGVEAVAGRLWRLAESIVGEEFEI